MTQGSIIAFTLRPEGMQKLDVVITHPSPEENMPFPRSLYFAPLPPRDFLLVVRVGTRLLSQQSFRPFSHHNGKP